MPSISQLTKFALLLASAATVSAHPKFLRPRTLVVRQEASVTSSVASSASSAVAAVATNGAAAPQTPTTAAATNTTGGLTDLDILNFALTLENLESTFYTQGFAKFPDSDFAALGLTPDQITALKQVAATEQTHVKQLTAAISAAGGTPVQACTYNFGFTDAAGMVGTARVLEAVGISAYLGAAPLIKAPAILSAAGQIVTVEARHQTFIRTASKAVPVPNAFDTPLGPRSVFTLAAQFITSCPTGSNLQIQAFPSISLAGGGTNINAGQSLVLADPNSPGGAQFCAFNNQGQTMFAQLNQGACQVPSGMFGEAYMWVTRSSSIADSEILAGPSVLLLT